MDNSNYQNDSLKEKDEQEYSTKGKILIFV